MNGETLLVNLRLAKRSQERMSRQCAAQADRYKSQMAAAIRQGDVKTILMYAQQSIRQDNMRVVFTRMAVQTQIVYDQVRMAQQQCAMTQTIVRVARIMAAMSQHNKPEMMMRACESLRESNETIEVAQAVFDQALGSVTATTTPSDEVAALIARVSDEHHIDLRQQFADAPAGSVMAQARARSAPARAAEASPLAAAGMAYGAAPSAAVAAASQNDVAADEEIQRRLRALK